MSYEIGLEREKRNIGEIENKENSKKILEFLDDLELNNLSVGRRYAYALRLRKIESLLKDKFLDPDEKDIKQVLYTIQHTKIKWGSGELHFPTNNQQESYRITLKRFYKWLLGEDSEYPRCVKFIKIGNSHPSQRKKPEDMISENQIQKIIENSLNHRDKALFSLLYDSGCRIGELLTLKIKDVKFDDFGAMILVSGKTGVRQVRIIGDSIPLLRSWIEVHPDLNNKDSFLFCGISGSTIKKQMNYHEVYSSLRKTLKRAGIQRRIHPHLFRHTRGTILASKAIGNAPLESQMGWVHGSRQTATYIHLSGKEQDMAILKAYGFNIEDEESQEKKPIKCPRCGELNISTAKKCKKCWIPLDINEALKEQQESMEPFMRFASRSPKHMIEFIEYLAKDPIARKFIESIGREEMKRSGSKENPDDEVNIKFNVSQDDEEQ